MLPNVKQKTIKPIIEAMVVKGTMIYTDEYSIYARLPVWGYQHKTVCHGLGQFPRRRGDGWVRQIALTSFLPGAVVIDFPDDLCAAA
jgi:hypothetical protein